MSARRKPHSAATRAKQSAASKGNPQGRKHLAKLNRERAVKWNTPMRAVMLADYIRGRTVYEIAARVGVDRCVVDKEMNRLKLPRGRWVGPPARLAAVHAAIGAARHG